MHRDACRHGHIHKEAQLSLRFLLLEAQLRRLARKGLVRIKADQDTHYLWRTQGDDKVRPSHAAREDRAFRWDEPPADGPPGTAYGCRCRAESIAADSAEAGTRIQWDREASLKHLRRHALLKSAAKCATFIRQALNAGGFPNKHKPKDAKDYRAYLTLYGFAEMSVSITEYRPEVGDITVIQSYPGGNSSGHIAMFDGQEWISDFRQRDMWSGSGYRSHQPAFRIYRHP